MTRSLTNGLLASLTALVCFSGQRASAEACPRIFSCQAQCFYKTDGYYNRLVVSEDNTLVKAFNRLVTECSNLGAEDKLFLLNENGQASVIPANLSACQ